MVEGGRRGPRAAGLHAGKEPDIQAEGAGSAQPGPSLRRVPIPALADMGALRRVPIPALTDMGALAWVPVMGTERPKSSNDQKGHTWVLCLDEQKVLERTLCLLWFLRGHPDSP